MFIGQTPPLLPLIFISVIGFLSATVIELQREELKAYLFRKDLKDLLE